MNKKEVKKNITIEDLAGMVKRGFDGQNKRFDGIDKRFDGIDKRLDGHDKRFDDIDKRLDGHDKRFDGIDKRLLNLEVTVNILREDFTEMKELVNKIYNHLDKILLRYDKIEQENIVIKARLSKIEKFINEKFQVDINTINF